MEVPDLLEQRLDEKPRGGVTLDGEDVVVFTRNRTFIYRGESLLSDARVEVYGNDIDRLSVSSGRRKTSFRLESVEGTTQFAVGSEYAEAVLEGLFGGILAAADLLDGGERVRGVYLFSDLTVVVTDAQLVKHIGGAVWDSDYETFPFGSVTGLDFEEGEVATQVVLWVDGRAERIKAPNDKAPLLQRTLTRALCGFHGVDSLDQLTERLSTGEEGALPTGDDRTTSNSSIALEEDIAPLIEATDEKTQTEERTELMALDTSALTDPGHKRESDRPDTRTGDENSADEQGTAVSTETLEQQVAELAHAIERQNELLERQSRQLDALAKRIDSDD